MANQLQLILGGARSGKSRTAEQRVVDTGLNKIYLATATAGDGEMSERIKKHQGRSRWPLAVTGRAVLTSSNIAKYSVPITAFSSIA